ncbi:MAG: hypothetical protein MIO92_06380 [Methanosarcinaceae archaeon]|nr:hypothetical protein [Methanosarcinaceae archaeon]
MKRIKYLIITNTIIIFTISYAFCQNNRTENWEEDIDYLIKRLEITHPNPYANISKELFLDHAEK